MRAKTVLLFLIMFLPNEALGQICSISHYPYGWGYNNRPILHGNKLKNNSVDLPFIRDELRRSRYAQFWVSADVLNIRSGPSFEHKVVSETYYGNLVFAYAKHGDWIAITKGVSSQNIELEPTWVNIKYLSPNRITDHVEIEILKRKCSFMAYGASGNKTDNGQYITPSSCKPVLRYLSHQRLLSRSHNYWHEYEIWRKSQEQPEKYRSYPCALRVSTGKN